MSGQSNLSTTVVPGVDLIRSYLYSGTFYAARVYADGRRGSAVNFLPQIVRFQFGLGVQNVLWGTFDFGPGYVGLEYQFQFFIENVVQPTVYSIVGGSLPPGLTLTNIGVTAEGEISGTPTTIGTYSFTMRAENIGGATDKDFTIEISGLPIGGFAVL